MIASSPRLSLIHISLEKAGYGYVPVVGLSAQGIEKNSGFSFTPGLLNKAVQAIVYGDVFMRTVYHTRPYEVKPGSVNKLHRQWAAKCKRDIAKGNFYTCCLLYTSSYTNILPSLGT